jgi:cytochrome c oxidase assembly protein subunit 11
VFCEITGLNGKTAGPYQMIDTNMAVQKRDITVQFISNNNSNISWPFKPLQKQLVVNPGKQHQVAFSVTNTSLTPVIAQAVPSVSPSEAAEYFHKIECFCFQNQPLQAGESKELPLVFFIDPDLPKHIKKLTLSYTLFDITANTEIATRSS